MAGLRVHFVFPAELVGRVDAALADGQSRGEFVRAAVEDKLRADGFPERLVEHFRKASEQALSEAKEPTRQEQADPGSVSSSEGVRSAAPAEQPSAVELEAECDRLASEYEERARSYRQHVPPPDPDRRRPLARSSSAAKRDVRPVPKKGEK